MLHLELSESEFSFLFLLYCETRVSVVLLPLKQSLVFHPDDCEYLRFTCSFHQRVPLLWSVNIQYSPVLVLSDPKVSAFIQTRRARNRKFMLYFRKCILYICTRLYQEDTIALFLFCLPQESDYATKLFFSEYYYILASCYIS